MRYDTQFISEKEGDFNPNIALKGSTLASKTGGEEQGTNVFTSVENFQRVEADKYSATVDGTTHYFNSAGKCIDDANVGNLVFVESNIAKDITNTATSGNSEGDENKKATISSLNPRDYFAQEIMNGFMRNIDKPFNMTDADIYKYSLLSYKVAQSMINVAAFNRATDPQSGSVDPSAEVVIDKATLNGNTEKLLNNIVAALDKTNAEITVGTEVGLKAERITIPELNKLIEDLKTLQENYVKDGNNTVGLKDLIAAINTTLTSLKNITSIGSINSLPDIEGNINSSVSGTISATLSRGSSASSPLYISSNMSNLNFQAIADNRIKLFAAALKESNSSLVIPDAWKS